MAKPLSAGRVAISLGLVLCSAANAAAGDVFTGFQIDNHKQYYAYLGARTPLTSGESSLQPFIQVLGGGFGYSFKDQGATRDANVQFVSPALGLKYTQGGWTYSGFAGPQFRWKQEQQPNGTRSDENDIGVYVQGEAFYWHEKGTFHAIVNYTELDDFFWGRMRGTRLVHKSEQGCCSTYLGWDVTGMGNTQFYAIATGPLVEVPIDRFRFTVRGGYQYTETFRSGGYGGLELYFPF